MQAILQTIAPPGDRPQSRFYALFSYRQRLRELGALKAISQSAAIVLLALADFADVDGYCWPAVGRLVAENPVSERSARRALRELEEIGLLVREERPGRTTRYRLNLDWHATPATTAAGYCNNAPKPGHIGTQNNTCNQENPREHQQTAPGSDGVVVEKTLIPREGGAGPGGLKLPHDLLMELKSIGVRAPWKLACYGESRLREAIAMAGSARNVNNKAGWILAALKNGWTPARGDAGPAALREETRQYVQQVEAVKAQLADPDEAKRSRLGMLATIVAVKKPTSDQLAELLVRHKVTSEEFTAYMAGQTAS